MVDNLKRKRNPTLSKAEPAPVVTEAYDAAARTHLTNHLRVDALST